MEYYGSAYLWKGASFLRVAALIFEGGPLPADSLQAEIRRLRRAVTLDALERYVGAGLRPVILATNDPELAAEAAGLGVQIWPTAEPFHFGDTLRTIVRTIQADGIVYASGAALPLLSGQEIQLVLDALAAPQPTVVVNNVQSADLIAWAPLSYLERVTEELKQDNFLGWLLRETGMERVLLPHSAAVHFDLDTPTDWLTLKGSGLGGARTRAALATNPWSVDRLASAAAILEQDLPEVALIGRVGTGIVDHINKWLRVRLRLFSEERGMKALGREEAGLVWTVVGEMIEALGPERFFETLARGCDACFFDTRPLFAHLRGAVSDWDRFCSDLGWVTEIQDPWVRRFTAAALAAPIPVVLGGHAVVTGGLWLLADRAIARRGGPAQSAARGFSKGSALRAHPAP
jgi:CTP:molybdopterin cytidylyltransferase MocA